MSTDKGKGKPLPNPKPRAKTMVAPTVQTKQEPQVDLTQGKPLPDTKAQAKKEPPKVDPIVQAQEEAAKKKLAEEAAQKAKEDAEKAALVKAEADKKALAQKQNQGSVQPKTTQGVEVAISKPKADNEPVPAKHNVPDSFLKAYQAFREAKGHTDNEPTAEGHLRFDSKKEMETFLGEMAAKKESFTGAEIVNGKPSGQFYFSCGSGTLYKGTQDEIMKKLKADLDKDPDNKQLAEGLKEFEATAKAYQKEHSAPKMSEPTGSNDKTSAMKDKLGKIKSEEPPKPLPPTEPKKEESLVSKGPGNSSTSSG